MAREDAAQLRPATPPRRPKRGGRCEAVWRELDRMEARRKAVPRLSEIRKAGARKGWNENNTRIEYYQWRRSKGIHGRLDP
jgi:hypothetical protein